MTLTVRVHLVNGNTHRIELPDDDPAAALARLSGGAEPFHSEWVEASNGELIRKSAIVSMYVEPGGEEPPVAFA